MAKTRAVAPARCEHARAVYCPYSLCRGSRKRFCCGAGCSDKPIRRPRIFVRHLIAAATLFGSATGHRLISWPVRFVSIGRHGLSASFWPNCPSRAFSFCGLKASTLTTNFGRPGVRIEPLYVVGKDIVLRDFEIVVLDADILHVRIGVGDEERHRVPGGHQDDGIVWQWRNVHGDVFVAELSAAPVQVHLVVHAARASSAIAATMRTAPLSNSQISAPMVTTPVSISSGTEYR